MGRGSLQERCRAQPFSGGRLRQTVDGNAKNSYRGLVTTYVGLLRAVNLGAHNKIGMADLRALLDALGLLQGQTLLQSGNVVFRTDARSPAELERVIEAALVTRLRLETDVLVRSHEEWKAIIAANPFPREAEKDPSHLLAVPLQQAPQRANVKALQDAIEGREIVHVHHRCAYIFYPDGIGRSRLTNALIEKRLGTRGTGRNWNTVRKLDALADSMR